MYTTLMSDMRVLRDPEPTGRQSNEIRHAALLPPYSPAEQLGVR
jgi:hypothetical protein